MSHKNVHTCFRTVLHCLSFIELITACTLESDPQNFSFIYIDVLFLRILFFKFNSNKKKMDSDFQKKYYQLIEDQ